MKERKEEKLSPLERSDASGDGTLREREEERKSEDKRKKKKKRREKNIFFRADSSCLAARGKRGKGEEKQKREERETREREEETRREGKKAETRRATEEEAFLVRSPSFSSFHPFARLNETEKSVFS